MGGKVQHILREFPLLLVIANDNMGAGNIFYVKPHVVVARQAGGYVVVLHIVLANQDFDVAVMDY